MNNIYINQDSLFQQYQNITTDFYSVLQKEMETLNEVEIAELTKYQPYVEANTKLGILVQSELINLVKRQINNNPEVIKSVIDSIKGFKKEKTKEMSDFQDYIKSINN